MGEPTEDSGIAAAVAMWDAARPVREPTDEVVLAGGPLDGVRLDTSGGVTTTISLGATVTYRDTGRRTADGRRVFAPEG